MDCAWGAHDMTELRPPADRRAAAALRLENPSPRPDSPNGVLPRAQAVPSCSQINCWGRQPGRGNLRPRPFTAEFGADLVRHNLESGAMLLADRINRRRPRRRLQPGEGMVVGDGVGQKAVSCDRDGVYRELSARCTHLGCIVASEPGGAVLGLPLPRFALSPDGSVIEGPAVAPLERSQVITPRPGTP